MQAIRTIVERNHAQSARVTAYQRTGIRKTSGLGWATNVANLASNPRAGLQDALTSGRIANHSRLASLSRAIVPHTFAILAARLGIARYFFTRRDACATPAIGAGWTGHLEARISHTVPIEANPSRGTTLGIAVPANTFLAGTANRTGDPVAQIHAAAVAGTRFANRAWMNGAFLDDAQAILAKTIRRTRYGHLVQRTAGNALAIKTGLPYPANIPIVYLSIAVVVLAVAHLDLGPHAARALPSLSPIAEGNARATIALHRSAVRQAHRITDIGWRGQPFVDRSIAIVIQPVADLRLRPDIVANDLSMFAGGKPGLAQPNGATTGKTHAGHRRLAWPREFIDLSIAIIVHPITHFHLTTA